MASRSLRMDRARAIQAIQERLERHSFPRLQMFLLVALTGGCGLLASFGMLRLGLGTTALRYPLALAAAYLFFLFLIWLWLRTNARDYLDAVPDANLGGGGGSSEGLPGLRSGGGGDFGGGGASGSFDGAGTVVRDAVPVRSSGASLGDAVDGDGFAIPLLVIALAIGLAVASLYVVYIAPVLFAEVLVDGALSYALFRHLRGHDPQHWLVSAFRRTVLPFGLTALFLFAVGAGMAAYAPGAVSVGQVLEHARMQK